MERTNLILLHIKAGDQRLGGIKLSVSNKERAMAAVSGLLQRDKYRWSDSFVLWTKASKVTRPE